jgi:hypothetical protein
MSSLPIEIINFFSLKENKIFQVLLISRISLVLNLILIVEMIRQKISMENCWNLNELRISLSSNIEYGKEYEKETLI